MDKDKPLVFKKAKIEKNEDENMLNKENIDTRSKEPDILESFRELDDIIFKDDDGKML